MGEGQREVVVVADQSPSQRRPPLPPLPPPPPPHPPRPPCPSPCPSPCPCSCSCSCSSPRLHSRLRSHCRWRSSHLPSPPSVFSLAFFLFCSSSVSSGSIATTRLLQNLRLCAMSSSVRRCRWLRAIALKIRCAGEHVLVSTNRLRTM